MKRKLSILLTTMMMLFLAACGSTAPSGAEAVASKDVIKIGWVPCLCWTSWGSLPELMESSDLQVELVPFKSSNEVIVALSSGAIDMGTAGYNAAASILVKQELPAKFVSGISSKGSVFIASPKSDIKSWADLKGKKIGTLRGTTQYVQLLTGMNAQGLDLNKDSEFVNFQSFNDLNLALQRGDIDAMNTFPPNSGMAVSGGYGVEVPAINDSLYDGSFYISSGVLASNKLIESRPDDVQKIIDALYAQGEKLDGDKDLWVETFGKLATSTEPAALLASLHSEQTVWDPQLNEDQLNKVAATLAELKEIPRNTSVELIAMVDYSFLEKASGKTAAELGQK